MTPDQLTTAIKETFGQKTVAIIGDLVADQYLNGTISRVSREAPVFILRHDNTSTFPGAAANAAANVASLGGKPIVVGVVGEDPNGTLLIAKMRESGIDCSNILTDPAVTTTTKVRILAGQQHASRQQVIRVDYENKATYSDELSSGIKDKLAGVLAAADAVIISDYNYGVAESEIVEVVRKMASERNIPLVVDSRFRLSEFKDVKSATPNQDEVEQILGNGFDDADCLRLRSELGLEALLVTNGNKGMRLFEGDKPPQQIDAVGSDQAVDVTGAGDTVIAAYTLALASGMSYSDAATVANHAGGLVVMKKGTAVVTGDELILSLASSHLSRQSKGTT